MLFSGLAQSYQCPNCEKLYSTTIPTSLLPMLVLLVIASALWTETVNYLIPSELAALGVGFLIALGSIPTSIFFVQRLLVPWSRTLCCIECGVKLEAKGGGFIDGAPPGKYELLGYLLVVATPAFLVCILNFFD